MHAAIRRTGADSHRRQPDASQLGSQKSGQLNQPSIAQLHRLYPQGKRDFHISENTIAGVIGKTAGNGKPGFFIILPP